MINRILVPLDKSPYTASAIHYACDIAKRHNAELKGIVVFDPPKVEKGGFYSFETRALAEKFERHLLEEFGEIVHELHENFKRKCEAEGIKHREAEFKGVPSSQIIEVAKTYDLLVMGQRTHYNAMTDKSEGTTLTDILDYSVTPILAVPKTFKTIHNVLITYDNSYPSVHALKDFARLAAYTYDVEIKIVTADKEEDLGKYFLKTAWDYLQIYEFVEMKQHYVSKGEGKCSPIVKPFTKIETLYSKDNIIQTIEKEELLHWTDLAVAGINSRVRKGKVVTGSFLKYLFDYGECPVLIGH